MASPVITDIPHKLGRETARARIAKGIGKIADLAPGGGTVTERWDGDTVYFTVSAMGQSIDGRLDVRDDHVHAELKLPMFLAMFAEKIREKLEKEAPKMLE